MADKQITVAVPEERVPEFYVWFANFLSAEPGRRPGVAGRRGRGGPRGGPHHGHGEPAPWSAADGDEAAWLYGRLAPPARALFDALIDAPGERRPGNELAARLGLEKGAHGVAGILAWPGATRASSPASCRSPPRAAPTAAPTTTWSPPSRSCSPPRASRAPARPADRGPDWASWGP